MMFLFHFSFFSQVWDRAEEFIPERFDLEGPVPNESNTDYRSASIIFPFGFTSLNVGLIADRPPCTIDKLNLLPL